ncbi:MAG: hypothetical protein LBR45_05495 [Bacteroidales bacterium]|jgi:tetratricopeptide (TPR) repeat protein|nr:hypothetical protein [Bacteroidales bacterium]
MKKLFITCICLCFILQSAAAQSQQNELANLSPDGNEMYQKALQALKAAVNDEGYANALSFAKKILVFDPNRADVCYKIGEIALLIEDITGNIAYRNEAVRYFEKAVQMDESYSSKVDEQYRLMSSESEHVQSAEQPSAQPSLPQAQETQQAKSVYNDLIMLVDGKITSESLSTIQKNQPFLYNKYMMDRFKHKKLRDAGWITFGVGMGTWFLGGVLGSVFMYSGEGEGLIALSVIGATAGIYAGIPMVIVGAVRMKRNDRRIVDEYNMMMLSGNRAEATFSLGTTSNGIGFLVKF